MRDIAVTAGREARLELTGVETQLDRVILDGISETIVHLLRNAVSHGIEPPDDRVAAGKPREGTIELSAQGRGDRVAVTVADDGRGVPPALLEQAEREGSLVDVLARAGFSTAEQVDELSGRGVGLDAVKRHVESLGGALDVYSRPGEGTAVTLLLPLTLSLLHLLLFERGGQTFGLPLASVLEAVTPRTCRCSAAAARSSCAARASASATSPTVIGASAAALPERPPAVVVASSTQRVALAVDAVTGEQETVVKPLGSMLVRRPGLPRRRDPARRHRRARPRPGVRRARRAPAAAPPPRRPRRRRPRRPSRRGSSSSTTSSPCASCSARSSRPRATRWRPPRTGSRRSTGCGSAASTSCSATSRCPGMDGLELLAAVRADADLGSLPFVIVTSRGSEEDRQKGAEAGADAYVVKGEFDQQALLDTVRRLAVLR